MTGSLPMSKTSQGAAANRDGPAMDIVHTDHGYRICAELPGLEASDVSLSVADGHVTLTGEAREGSGPNANRFTCVLALPEDADTDTAKAELQNGLLTLTIERKGALSLSARPSPGLRDLA